MIEYIDYQGVRHYYERRAAKNGDICLGTKDPASYCNGTYKFSTKDPGNGIAFVLVSVGKPPKFVSLDGVAMRLQGDRYYRDAGRWSVDFKHADGSLVALHPGPRAHKIPLRAIDEDSWAKDNGRYAAHYYATIKKD